MSSIVRQQSLASRVVALLMAVIFCVGPVVAAEGVEPAVPCSCDSAIVLGGWCERCGVGYIAGVEIQSQLLWETLDAHGHPIDQEMLQCPSCARAVQESGFCELHQRGFVDGQAYLSRLTYHLAKGEPQDLSTIQCPVCRGNTAMGGWCEEHGLGMIGNVAIRDRADFEQATRAFQVLLSAIERVPQCELCACALATNGRCPIHRRTFKDGLAVP